MANNPNVNKVVYGNQTVMDISDTTAEEGDVVSGKTFYKASGARSTGSAVIPDISNCYQTTDTAETDIQDADYFPFYDTSASAKKKSLWSNIVAKMKTAFGISSGSTYLKKDGTWGTPTDTKNTAGSTDTSDKIYLVGAKSQAANPQTYSDNEVFAQDGVLSSKKLSPKCITALTGTGTAGQDKGSGSTNRYVPALWTFNSGITVADGEVYFIKIPVAGGTWGVYLSLNNGTNYYPVAVSNGKGRFTTHYGQNMVIGVTYESAGVCNCYARTGADTLADVTGCFRVFDSYDSNTTYSAMSTSELTTGTVTTSRVVRSDYLKSGINSLIDTKINALDVTGASSIGAGKTIKAWSETDGKVSLTTQDISITKSQVSDFPDLSVYAPLASPAFTGTPTAPTAYTSTATSQIATTSFVHNVTASKYDYNDPYTSSLSDDDTHIPILNTSGTYTSKRTKLGNIRPVFLVRTGLTASAGTTIRIPASGTNEFITYGCHVEPVCDSQGGKGIKYDQIACHDYEGQAGYVEIRLAQNITNRTIGIKVIGR